MLPVMVVRKLLRMRAKISRNRVLQIASAVVILALLFAVLFMYSEGVDFYTALYWAVITMATIGYGDVTPATPLGRAVAMVAAVAGISTFTALVSVLAEFFISSSLRRMMGMHRVRYSGHYIIIGQGSTVPSCVGELLSAISRGEADTKPIVVVFPDEAERKKVQLPEEIEVLVGDPTSEETLKRARVETASHVILALEDDSKAVFTTLMVKRLSKAKVLVEALREESVDLLKQAGADRVILSRSFAGRLLASSVFEPEAVDVVDDVTTSLGRYDISVILREDLWGKSYLEALRELRKSGYSLIGYYLNGPVLNPGLDEPIPHGAKLIVIKPSAS
ncbi:calcium-gated potassium channel protein [Thermococcus profundus]|uniref:Calcium-gated potassium channel protein n=1 Tax=Thermococcus profundus TaxID=49899 RepID=A0A2Z2M6D8_THEPR|nr:NAD-binding protein [Thermococcus profundus]ASJ01890.1 calcium-gated potassium channel protein [Thermococcus profundus]